MANPTVFGDPARPAQHYSPTTPQPGNPLDSRQPKLVNLCWHYTTQGVKISWTPGDSTLDEHPHLVAHTFEGILADCFPRERPEGFPATGVIIVRISYESSHLLVRFIDQLRGPRFLVCFDAVNACIDSMANPQFVTIAGAQEGGILIEVKACTNETYAISSAWNEQWRSRRLESERNVRKFQLADAPEDKLLDFEAYATSVVEALKPQLPSLLVDNPPETYELRKELVDRINRLLFAAGMTLEHPETKKPVSLQVAQSRPGHVGTIRIRQTDGSGTPIPLTKLAEISIVKTNVERRRHFQNAR